MGYGVRVYPTALRLGLLCAAGKSTSAATWAPGPVGTIDHGGLARCLLRCLSAWLSQPNYRGSTGYGAAFSDDVIGHYFHHMLPDVIAGCDFLIAQGLVDGARMGKRGYSAVRLHKPSMLVLCIAAWPQFSLLLC